MRTTFAGEEIEINITTIRSMWKGLTMDWKRTGFNLDDIEDDPEDDPVMLSPVANTVATVPYMKDSRDGELKYTHPVGHKDSMFQISPISPEDAEQDLVLQVTDVDKPTENRTIKEVILEFKVTPSLDKPVLFDDPDEVKMTVDRLGIETNFKPEDVPVRVEGIDSVIMFKSVTLGGGECEYFILPNCVVGVARHFDCFAFSCANDVDNAVHGACTNFRMRYINPEIPMELIRRGELIYEDNPDLLQAYLGTYADVSVPDPRLGEYLHTGFNSINEKKGSYLNVQKFDQARSVSHAHYYLHESTISKITGVEGIPEINNDYGKAVFTANASKFYELRWTRVWLDIVVNTSRMMME